MAFDSNFRQTAVEAGIDPSPSHLKPSTMSFMRSSVREGSPIRMVADKERPKPPVLEPISSDEGLRDLLGLPKLTKRPRPDEGSGGLEPVLKPLWGIM
jgi:hypothetical protein